MVYRIIERKADCVLLARRDTGMRKVVDTEGDTLYMGNDGERARAVFDSYSLDAERRLRAEIFEGWLRDNAGAE